MLESGENPGQCRYRDEVYASKPDTSLVRSAESVSEHEAESSVLGLCPKTH